MVESGDYTFFMIVGSAALILGMLLWSITHEPKEGEEKLACARCGRELDPDTCLEGVDWSQGAIQLDGDWPYTGEFFCGHGEGCQVDLICPGGPGCPWWEHDPDTTSHHFDECGRKR